MSRDWWDTDDTDTGHRDTGDSATPGHQVPEKTQHTATGHRDTSHATGRVLTLHRRPEGPRPIDELLADKQDTAPRQDTATHGTPRTTTANTKAARRALRKETTQRSATGQRDTGADDTEEETPDTRQDPATLAKRLGQILSKTQQAAVTAADDAAALYRDDEDRITAEQERVARAIDTLTEVLQPVEPDRSWLPDWARTVGTVVLFNLSAAAAGHYTIGLLGYPDLSPAVVVYDITRNFTAGYHWSTGLFFGSVPPLTCWLLFDRRTRHWHSTILRWIVRLPLAAASAGVLAASWRTIIHLATGATS